MESVWGLRKYRQNFLFLLRFFWFLWRSGAEQGNLTAELFDFRWARRPIVPYSPSKSGLPLYLSGTQAADPFGDTGACYLFDFCYGYFTQDRKLCPKVRSIVSYRSVVFLLAREYPVEAAMTSAKEPGFQTACIRGTKSCGAVG